MYKRPLISCSALLLLVAGISSAPAAACPWNGCGTDAYNAAQAYYYDPLYAYGPPVYGYAPPGYGPAAYGYLPPVYGSTAYGYGRRVYGYRPAYNYGYYGPAPVYGYYPASPRIGWDYGRPVR